MYEKCDNVFVSGPFVRTTMSDAFWRRRRRPQRAKIVVDSQFFLTHCGQKLSWLRLRHGPKIGAAANGPLADQSYKRFINPPPPPPPAPKRWRDLALYSARPSDDIINGCLLVGGGGTGGGWQWIQWTFLHTPTDRFPQSQINRGFNSRPGLFVKSAQYQIYLLFIHTRSLYIERRTSSVRQFIVDVGAAV